MPNQKFYNKTPENPFGQQTTPPGYANNQRVPQNSSLELLMENYVMNQSKQLQELKNQTYIRGGLHCYSQQNVRSLNLSSSPTSSPTQN